MARLSADGTKILENYDRFTGVAFNANVTTVYANGSTMDDSKVDNVIYFKNTTALGGGYSVRSEFIENRTVNITWFGAVGQSGVDNADAFENIEAFLIRVNPDSAGKLTLLFPNAQSAYLSSRPLNVPLNVNVIMNTGMVYSGDKTLSALKIGIEGQTNSRLNHKLDVRSAPSTDWSIPTCIGIEIINSYESTGIMIDRANGFTEGVRLIGDGAGVVYNKIFLGQLQNNKIALKMTNRNSGWCNENIVFGGRFQVSGAANVTQDRYGVIIDSEDGLYGNNNNNNFYEPSFEINSNADVETIPIVINYGAQNAFYNIRNENGSFIACVMRTLNTSNANILEIGYSAGNVTFEAYVQDNGDYPSTYMTSRQLYNRSFSPKKSMYNSGNLISRVFNYDTTNFYAENELFFFTSTGTRTKDTSSISRDTATNSIILSSSRGISVRVDTRFNKRFVVNKNIATGNNGGRINIRPLDASGNVITPSGTALVKGYQSYIPAYNSTFGGVYRQGSDTTSNLYFVVDSAVKYIDVILSGGTTSASLLSFDIQTLDNDSLVINSTTRKGFCSPIKPTVTTYNLGTEVLNSAPDIGGVFGWRLVSSSGTPQWIEIESDNYVGIGSTNGIFLEAESIDADLIAATNVAYLSATSSNLPDVTVAGGVVNTIRYLNSTSSAFQTYGHIGLDDSLWFRRKSSVGAWGSWFQVASRQWATPKPIINTTSTPFTKSTLNTAYPNAKIGQIVVQDAAGFTYIKKDDSATGNWSVFATTELT